MLDPTAAKLLIMRAFGAIDYQRVRDNAFHLQLVRPIHLYVSVFDMMLSYPTLFLPHEVFRYPDPDVFG